jgi:hypothetical protein
MTIAKSPPPPSSSSSSSSSDDSSIYIHTYIIHYLDIIRA